MLRRIVQRRSLQLWLRELDGCHALPSSTAPHAPSTLVMTNLRHFTPSACVSDDKSDQSAPGEVDQARPAPSKDNTQHPSSTATANNLQNTKLWRQWVDGRIDDRHRSSPTSSTTTTTPSSTQQQQQPQQRQKHRPKDPSKQEWKHANRSMRNVQERIASILSPDADDPTAGVTPNATATSTSTSTSSRHQYSGKYGVLGTAADAPRHVPGAAAKAEETSPDRLLPHRLFYPGATYAPEDLDPYKAKPVAFLSDLNVQRGSISPSLAVKNADFRNPAFLNNFISDAGKIQSRRRTRMPAKVHRETVRQIKLARMLALMCPTAKVHPPRRVFGAPPTQRSQAAASSASGVNTKRQQR